MRRLDEQMEEEEKVLNGPMGDIARDVLYWLLHSACH